MPYPINLIDWKEADSGDVITPDGEYLGRWYADWEDHPSFVPDGHSVIVCQSMFLGDFCRQIVEWSNMTPDEREAELAEARLRHDEDPDAALYAMRLIGP